MGMTTDALLVILLNVAIPSVLAILGGILAARSLPAERIRYERWLWTSGFLGLALLAVVLAVIQQVRLTTYRVETDRKANETEGRLRADSKFTQGQLDTMTKVLTTLASTTTKPQDGNMTAAMLKALAATGRSLSTAPSLKDKLIHLSSDLANFYSDRKVAESEAWNPQTTSSLDLNTRIKLMMGDTAIKYSARFSVYVTAALDEARGYGLDTKEVESHSNRIISSGIRIRVESK
jgi:hypothetical protein